MCEECLLPVEKPTYDIQPYVASLGYEHTDSWRHERCFWNMVQREGLLNRHSGA